MSKAGAQAAAPPWDDASISACALPLMRRPTRLPMDSFMAFNPSSVHDGRG